MIRTLIWLSLILSASLTGVVGSSIVFSTYLCLRLYTAIFKSRNWINPAFFYGISLLVTTLANIKLITQFETGIFSNNYPYARFEYFGESAMVWALGNLFILEAYSWRIQWKLPILAWDFRGRNPLQILFWISMALVFRRFWLPFSLPGALDSIFQLIPLLSILMHARLAELQSNRGLFYRAVLLTALATSQAVLFAYLRINMIIPILVFFLGTLSAAKTVWTLGATRFYPFYGFLLIFSTFFAVFGARRSELAYGFARITQLQQAKVEFATADDRTQLSAFERSSTIGQLSAAVGLVKDQGYYQGRASAPLLIALIPRFLWPDKPKIALGVWFAMNIGAAIKTESWYNNSINMTIPGHLYLDFGWLGLIVGSILTGRFLRLLWETTHFIGRPLNFTSSLFAVYLLYMSFLGLGADLQILVTFLAIYLIILTLDRGLQRLFPRRQSTNGSKAKPLVTKSLAKSQ